MESIGRLNPDYGSISLLIRKGPPINIILREIPTEMINNRASLVFLLSYMVKIESIFPSRNFLR